MKADQTGCISWFAVLLLIILTLETLRVPQRTLTIKTSSDKMHSTLTATICLDPRKMTEIFY